VLTKQGAIYHFRRKVPLPLRVAIGQAEVWASLGTTSATVARARAGLLYAATQHVFEAAAQMPRPDLTVVPTTEAEFETAIRDQEDAIRNYEQEAAMLQSQLAELRTLTSTIRHHQTSAADLAAAGKRLRAVLAGTARLAGRLDEARRHGDANGRIAETLAQAAAALAQPTTPPTAPIADAPLFNALTDDFLAAKPYSQQVRSQARATFRLWTELFGDEPVNTITGKQAVAFQTELRRLAASHGKARQSPPAPEAIRRADASREPVRRLAEKTIKRHISTMSQYWQSLKRLEHVERNVFEGFEFPGTKNKHSARDDWSEEDLRKLIGSEWRSLHVDVDTYRWLVCIAAYSGMRLEEIARLRPEDMQTHSGVPMFILQEHPDGWSPKSEAGGRAVPVHPRLIEIGFLNLVDRQRAGGHARILDRLRPGGPDGKLGYTFSREFSKHKSRIGVGTKTVFHSFRHSASTILRNADAAIRSEWIDAVLGHEGGQKSQGATTYLKRIGSARLRQTIDTLSYPADADVATMRQKA